MRKKHLPFNSPYLPNFEVVEEHEGKTTRFPHTEQLPKLLRALNLEFHTGLPDRIVHVDQRASGHMKIQKFMAAALFCSHFNRARQDKMILHVVMDSDLVARISIVQQTADYADQAPIHRFKFYAGTDFFKECYLNGRRLVFAQHALARFSERLPNTIGTDMTRFFRVVFGSPAVVMLCNQTPAFVFQYDESVIAFPVRGSDAADEYFLPTCLSANEINELEPLLPPPAYPWHYSPVRQVPEVRNWSPLEHSLLYRKLWERKAPLSPPIETKANNMRWSEIGYKICDVLTKDGFTEGSRLLFYDQIPGPSVIRLRPGEQEAHHNEIDDLNRRCPYSDWRNVVPEQKAANPQWYGRIDDH